MSPPPAPSAADDEHLHRRQPDARSPNKVYQLAAIQFPYVRAGCGGIDAFGGSFSHVSSQEFKTSSRQSLPALPGVAFQLALSSVSPLLGEKVSGSSHWRPSSTCPDQLLRNGTGAGGAAPPPGGVRCQRLLPAHCADIRGGHRMRTTLGRNARTNQAGLLDQPPCLRHADAKAMARSWAT